VVVSDRGSLPEVVGDAGLLIDPDDTQDLSAAIRRILDDDSLSASLRQKGLMRASTFSWARVAQQTMAIYDKMLAEG
jgi:alpha-1,3-rhamnosyl/mannosyltransferase